MQTNVTFVSAIQPTKANEFFFLADVPDHINVIFRQNGKSIEMIFSDTEDRWLESKLVVCCTSICNQVTGRKAYLVSYTAKDLNRTLEQGASLPIDQKNVYGVICAIVLDFFCLGEI